jgi:hypothetical protein
MILIRYFHLNLLAYKNLRDGVTTLIGQIAQNVATKKHKKVHKIIFDRLRLFVALFRLFE